jgi:hypothetical protein
MPALGVLTRTSLANRPETAGQPLRRACHQNDLRRFAERWRPHETRAVPDSTGYRNLRCAWGMTRGLGEREARC